LILIFYYSTTLGFLPKAELFNDPRRYDSDDEASSPLRGASPRYYGSSDSPVYPYPVHSINSGTPNS
jgi:hypothetical protein